MNPKPTILLIEDDAHWYKDLIEIIERYWDSNFEKFASFVKAKERIKKNPNNIDLLITDIFSVEDGVGKHEPIGLTITEFLNNVNKKTAIIVVTGDRSNNTSILNNYNVLNVFYKQEFDEFTFVNTVCRIIPSKINCNDIPKEKVIEEKTELNKPNTESTGGYIIS